MGSSELRIECAARPSDVKTIRHALDSFLSVFPIDSVVQADIELAVGEALANAVEHARNGSGSSEIALLARPLEDGTLAIDVCDRGRFIERDRLPNRGFGLNIVRAIARSVEIDTSSGTRVSMIFRLHA